MKERSRSQAGYLMEQLHEVEEVNPPGGETFERTMYTSLLQERRKEAKDDCLLIK